MPKSKTFLKALDIVVIFSFLLTNCAWSCPELSQRARELSINVLAPSSLFKSDYYEEMKKIRNRYTELSSPSNHFYADKIQETRARFVTEAVEIPYPKEREMPDKVLSGIIGDSFSSNNDVLKRVEELIRYIRVGLGLGHEVLYIQPAESRHLTVLTVQDTRDEGSPMTSEEKFAELKKIYDVLKTVKDFKIRLSKVIVTDTGEVIIGCEPLGDEFFRIRKSLDKREANTAHITLGRFIGIPDKTRTKIIESLNKWLEKSGLQDGLGAVDVKRDDWKIVIREPNWFFYKARPRKDYLTIDELVDYLARQDTTRFADELREFASAEELEMQKNLKILFDFLTERDLQELTEGLADILLLFGNDDFRTFEEVAEIYKKGIVRKIVVSGGAGRLTIPLINKMLSDPKYNKLVPEGIPEELLTANIEENWVKIGEKCKVTEAGLIKRILIKLGVREENIIEETESSNTAKNAEFTLTLLRERSIPHESFILVQTPLQQKRTSATFDKEVEKAGLSGGIKRISYAPYLVGENIQQYSPDELNALMEAAFGEIYRLKIYGPILKNFIAEVKIPEEVEEAYRYLLGKFGSIKHIEDASFANLQVLRSAGELAPAGNVLLNIVDAHVLKGMDKDRAESVLDTMNDGKNTKVSVIVFDAEDKWVADIAGEKGIVVVLPEELDGAQSPEQTAINKATTTINYTLPAIRSINVLSSVENISKWRPSLNGMARYIVCNNNITISGILKLYEKLPPDIKSALEESGITIETIQRSDVVNSDGTFNVDKVKNNSIVEISA